MTLNPLVDSTVIMDQYGSYRLKEDDFSKLFLWQDNILKDMSPLWRTMIADHAELSILASKKVALPPTSASVERSFSRHSWIHSLKRNRITNDQAAKLVYISHNYECENGDNRKEKRTTVTTEQPTLEAPPRGAVFRGLLSRGAYFQGLLSRWLLPGGLFPEGFCWGAYFLEPSVTLLYEEL